MNNKGMTLVEIIISIALISIVLIFLFSLLITVNDINDESEVNSTYLINKSLILKNIENDFSESNSITLSDCYIEDFYTNYTNDYISTLNNNQKANQCLKFTYDVGTADQSEGFLGIYYYKQSDDDKSSYVISYINKTKNIKATRQIPDFEINNVSDSNFKKNTALKGVTSIDLTGTYEINLTGFNVINIPIIGPDGKDYSINISYYA